MICSVEDCGRKRYALTFCNMHWQRQRNGVDLSRKPMNAAGKGHVRADGYHLITSMAGRGYEHVRIAENALGKPLPHGSIVHHVNENPSDNRPSNLVICPSREYHNLLHRRMRADKACGNPNWRKCPYCKHYDNPLMMIEYVKSGMCHRECRIVYMRERKLRMLAAP